MLIIPAVDLKDGKCVRLVQGKREQETIYSENPLVMARKWEQLGASLLHLVDLDGAFGKPLQTNLIKEIVSDLKIPVQLGGGIRSLRIMEAYLNMGVTRIILGTITYQNKSLVKEACQHFPNAIFAGIDAQDGLVAIKGWEEITPIKASDLVLELASDGIAGLIYTDISRDGMLTGPNCHEMRNIAKIAKMPVIASGGVSTLEHIRALKELERDGVIGVIIGKALYEGKIDFVQAMTL